MDVDMDINVASVANVVHCKPVDAKCPLPSQPVSYDYTLSNCSDEHVDLCLLDVSNYWQKFSAYCSMKTRRPECSADLILFKYQRQKLAHVLEGFVNVTKQLTVTDNAIEVWQNKPYVKVSGSDAKITDQSVPRTEMFLFNALFNNNVAHIMIDTGATHSFVNRDWVFNNHLEVINSADVPQVQVADNSYTSIDGKVQGHLKIGKCVIPDMELLSMSMMPDIDILLGADYLKQLCAVIDYESMSFTFKVHNRVHYFDRSILDGIDNGPEVLPPLRSKSQVKRFVNKGAKITVAWIRHKDVFASSVNADLQQANTSTETIRLTGKQILDQCKEVQELPKGIRNALYKHAVLFEALTPGTSDKYVYEHEVIPTMPHVPTFKPLYRMTPREKQELEDQIKVFLANGWIRPSTSPYGAPVLFAQKADGKLRLCIDYRMLNKVTIPNRYPLPHIQDLFDMMKGATHFSSLDLLTGYHQIVLQPSDVPKTAFRTHLGSFEVLVLWEGLTNAPSVFQSIMYSILRPYIGKFVALYIDDILIFSKSLADHESHIDIVLTALENNHMKLKLSKCQWSQKQLKFLGHIINGDGLQPDPRKVEAIKNWPRPVTLKQLQQFLGYANFLRRYVNNFSQIAHPLYELASELAWTKNWTDRHIESFEKLKAAIMETTMIWHPDPEKPYQLFVDASMKGCGAVLMQDISLDPAVEELKPVAYFSKQFSNAEKVMLPQDQEFYGMVYALIHFREYLEGVDFIIKTDNSPLLALNKDKSLSRKKANFLDIMARYTFEIQHIAGTKNVVADFLSRNPTWGDPDESLVVFPLISPFAAPVTRSGAHTSEDNAMELQKRKEKYPQFFENRDIDVEIEEEEEKVEQIEMIDMSQLPVAPDDESTKEFIIPLITEIIQGYALDPHFKRVRYTKQYIKSKTGLWLLQDDNKLPVYRKPVYNHRIVIPNAFDLRHRIMHFCHVSPYAGHRSVLGTKEQVAKDFWWPDWTVDIATYVSKCASCQKMKYRAQATPGLLKPLPIPYRRWGSISMDFITDLPKSGKQQFDTILVVVDRLSKMSHFVPTHKTATTKKVAQLLHDNIIKLHGLPDSIVSDRDPRFVSHFLSELFKIWGTQQCLSTAYRPQTDGQTERTNRTLQEYLRAYVNPSGKDWIEKLGMAEYAYNDSYHTAIGCTPFFLNFGEHPRSPLTLSIRQQSMRMSSSTFAKQMQFNVKTAKQLLVKAQNRMKQQYDKRHTHKEFVEGTEVLLSTENLKLTGCSKFWPRYIGPFKITKVINTHAYELALPEHWFIHPVFHISLLKEYKSDGSFQPALVPTELSDDMYHIDAIYDHRYTRRGKKKILQYLCGYNDCEPHSRTWHYENEIKGICPDMLKAYKLRELNRT